LLKHGVMQYMREPVDFEPLLEAGERELQALRERYWHEVREGGAVIQGKVFVDKHPLHTLKLPLIARLFPQAKILFATRDPRDVVLSGFRRRFAMNPAMYQLLSLRTGAAFYDVTMRVAELSRTLLGLEWREVRYETLASDLEAELRGICQYLGLEWVPNLGDFAVRAQAREHATPSTAQLARGLDTSGIGHWRHYRVALEPVLPILQPWVERLGYPD
jgi:Sulfotransferase family